ncbi:MAG: acetate kinase [Candidatus Atribacteria bacterium]|nr:acetate kinase [Candidatus Atribacteria bacterium]
MKILVINSGGSSIKYQLFRMDGGEDSLCQGSVKRLYREDAFLEGVFRDKKIKKEQPQIDHEQGLKLILETLKEEDFLQSEKDLGAIGIKLINGGKQITQTSFIDQQVIATLEDLAQVTAVHNPPALLAIKIFQEQTPSVPLIGVFETTFHLSIPLPHRLYGLPWELCQELKIEKLGFHGNSHRYISSRVRELSPSSRKLISCHLGSGGSVCAIYDGKSFDISSGFTPQSGTIMSTRPGDFDPQVITYLEEKKGWTPDKINNILTRESGLLGISGVSSEMWELEKLAETGNERAQLAIEVFVYQVKKYIGAFLALLNGVEVLSFTGGIGENDPYIRKQICSGLDFINLFLDQKANREMVGKEGKISSAASAVEVWVVPTNEELMIAREVYRLLAG